MTIAELRKRSNAFVSSLSGTIAGIVDNNEELKELNRQQLRSSQLSNGQQISRPYAAGYAFWKQKYFASSYGDGKPNMLLTGQLYDKMKIEARGNNYLIQSAVAYSGALIAKFGNIFGIAPDNRTKAQLITTKKLSELYKKNVTK